MALITRCFAAGLCLALLGQVAGYALGGRNQDEKKEAELTLRIEHEGNPGKKARLQIRLAQIKLTAAIIAYDRNDFARGKDLLDQYLGQMQNSWKTLQGSAGEVNKHLKAFKELDITLREDGRILGDLRRRVPYPENKPIDRVEQERRRIRSHVFDALFPGGFPRSKPKSSIPSQGSVAVRDGAGI